ncbi:IS30 family transposase [Patescibacteria group bacterium]|nr:IS30 family transposase [Patescibacteria group bacterium]
MRQTFKHLDFRIRDRIESLWDKGVEQKEIAKIVGVHKSTVSREIQWRKKEDGTYSATVAEHKAGVKRANSKYQGMKIEQNQWLKRHIVREMKQYRSPDEIAGKMKEERWKVRVSADAIYRWLRSSMGQRYCRYLCTKRYRKKPHSDAPKRHIIQNMRSIHSIPADPGWVTEGDTFLSPKKVSRYAGVLVGWRETKLLKGDLVKSLRPIHTTKVVRKIRNECAIDALILDQGGENREHEKFGVPSYFCDPASPRQKPFIESSIGLLRRWFWPKGTDLSKISKEEFQEKLEIINNKYRKTLRYRSASEVSRECGILK